MRPSDRRLLRSAGDDRTLGPPCAPRPPPPGPARSRWSRRRRRPGPPPTATSQPRASATGIDRAAARSPVGSGTPRCWFQPTAGPPMPSRRSDRSSWLAGTVSGPAGPHDHLVGRPRRLEPHLADGVGGDEHGVGGVGRSGQPVVGGLEPFELGLEVGEDLVALGPAERSRTASRLSSVSSSIRSRARRHPGASASSRASCSVVAMPSTAAQAADLHRLGWPHPYVNPALLRAAPPPSGRPGGMRPAQAAQNTTRGGAFHRAGRDSRLSPA